MLGREAPLQLYDLRTDADCVHNLVAEAGYNALFQHLRRRTEMELKAQDDPRMYGRVCIFNPYRPTSGDWLYERFKRDQQANTRWVDETDFEQELIPQP